MATVGFTHYIVPAVFTGPIDSPVTFPSLQIPASLAENRGLLRSVSRASTLMAICLGGLEEEARSLIARHADTAGIYCVLDNSVGPHIDLLKFAATGDPKDYARYVSPKWGLQSSLGIAASSLSIILGTRGGVQVFHHSRDAGLHAIQQAELDLETGAVSLAVVCSASSADDPMTLLKHRTLHPELRYSEGAAVMLLEAGVGQLNLSISRSRAGELFYGIANDLIKFTLGDRHAA